MPKMTVGNLSFEAPEGFAWNETMISLQAPAPQDIRDPRMLQKQAVVARPNLVVNQRTTENFRTIEAIVEDMTKRLRGTIKSMKELKASPLKFADGCEGILLSYLFSFNEKSMLTQMHAVRLDGDTITTMVLTGPGTLTEDEANLYIKHLASASVASGEAKD